MPRRCWLTVKILVLGTVSILVAAGLSAVVAWYRQPLDLLGGFDITGRHITGLDAVIMEGKAREGGGDPTTYLHDHGVQRWAVCQPIERIRRPTF
ncbi:hypothetical protein [Micromonospora sp. WMMD710]|uniref:hypothetical protein n=1 Tax=Micromonospora sp. WMMD710 TaxID=3016085 RepID=UPI002417D90F|nr:hypothetical protein [Micromonospora sp. WMMD710]MDG4758537.1 hypothetical protein [Micromonospora sp. WMMD710]